MFSRWQSWLSPGTQSSSELATPGSWRALDLSWHPGRTEPWLCTRRHRPTSFIRCPIQRIKTPRVHTFSLCLSACVSQVLERRRQLWPYKVQSQIPGFFDICDSQIYIWKEWKNNNKFIFQAVYYEFQCFPVSSHEVSFRLVIKPCLVYVGDRTAWLQWAPGASGKGMLTPFLPQLSDSQFPLAGGTGLLGKVQPQAWPPEWATAESWGPSEFQASPLRGFSEKEGTHALLFSRSHEQLHLVMKNSRKLSRYRNYRNYRNSRGDLDLITGPQNFPKTGGSTHFVHQPKA